MHGHGMGVDRCLQCGGEETFIGGITKQPDDEVVDYYLSAAYCDGSVSFARLI